MPKCLSDTAVRNAKPKSKPYKLSDGEGLFLLVMPNGSKYWRMKYSFGKEKLLAFGIYPDVSLSDARDKRAQARKKLAAGRDPGEEKKEAKRILIQKQENSFEVIAREWHENQKSKWTPYYAGKTLRRLEMHVFPGKPEKTPRTSSKNPVESGFLSDPPKLGKGPIADISSQELLAVIRGIQETSGIDTAHRMLQVCGQIFTYAIITGRAANNPAALLKGALKPLVKKNRAYIKPNELSEFLKILETYNGTLLTKLAVKFLLLTFVRTGEMRGADWNEIDFDKAEWRIPAERMKMRETHIVPLSSQAIAILRELKALTGQGRYVFPNQNKPAAKMSENTVLYALYRMGYHSRATGHGFRSTASTVLHEHGFQSDVIERQLAHTERNQVKAAYNHAQYLSERRKMMQWWGDFLDQMAAKRPSR